MSLQAKVCSLDKGAFHTFGPATVMDPSVKCRHVLRIMSPWATESSSM